MSSRASRPRRTVGCLHEALESRVLLTVVVAQTADSLADSVGVNIHMHFTDRDYNTMWTTWEPLLINSGIRHVRDGMNYFTGDNGWWVNRFEDLANNGIKADFLP